MEANNKSLGKSFTNYFASEVNRKVFRMCSVPILPSHSKLVQILDPLA